MKVRQGGFTVVEIVIVVLALAIVSVIGFFVLQQQQHQPLSAEQIDKKFDCNRVTADYRETDVFCGNTKFYNDPGSITKDDYYKYYACEERLKAQPPAGSAKTNDPGYYSAYYNCKDAAKLESLRQDFIKELEKLKAENS